MSKSKKSHIDISLAKAKTEKLFYVVVTGVIYNPRLKKCLILERSKKEITHPGLWGVIGGKIEWSDLKRYAPKRQNFDVPNWLELGQQVLKREAKEESGLEITDIHYITDLAYLRPDGVPTICIKYAARYKKGRVRLNSEFSNYAWVGQQEVKQFRCIKGINREIALTIKLFST